MLEGVDNLARQPMVPYSAGLSRVVRQSLKSVSEHQPFWR